MAKIYWKHTHDVFTDLDANQADFIAIDPAASGASEREKYIGRVYQNENGPEQGLWVWSMTVSLPGTPLPFPRGGAVAGRQVLDCYRRMLRFYELTSDTRQL